MRDAARQRASDTPDLVNLGSRVRNGEVGAGNKDDLGPLDTADGPAITAAGRVEPDLAGL